VLNYTVIHATVGKGLADKQEEVCFKLGDDAYTKRDFIQNIGVANWVAIANLSRVLRKLKVKTVNDLFNTDPYSLYRAKGIGDTALFVAMHFLHYHGYNPMNWWGDEKIERLKKLRRAAKHKQEV
jgi:hypothetical protein